MDISSDKLTKFQTRRPEHAYKSETLSATEFSFNNISKQDHKDQLC